MNSVSLVVVILSYNRGKNLSLCVDSLRSCSPNSRIIVFDDGSDDAETQDVLTSFQSDVTVLQSSGRPGELHGGLYNNMNKALQNLPDCDLVMFAQDDMQFVRAFGPDDLSCYSRLIDSAHGMVLLYPVFLKERTVKELQLKLSLCKKYYTSENSSICTGRFYSDVLIASPRALKAAEWKFGEGEYENAEKASQIFGAMRYLVNPIVAYVPRPKSYRRRKRNFAMIMIERLFRFGNYQLEKMSSSNNALFLARSPSVLPVAEEHLKVTVGSLKSPWAYSVFDLSPIVFPLYHLCERPRQYLSYQFKKRFLALRHFVQGTRK